MEMLKFLEKQFKEFAYTGYTTTCAVIMLKIYLAIIEREPF